MRVDFTQSFGDRLRVLEAFMVAQDPDSAPARIEELHSQVLRFIDIVKLHPNIGRPAAVLAASSIEGKRRLERVLQLANDAGLSMLREYVLRGYLMLYAHSDSRVLMLSVRHEREFGYATESA